MTAPVLTTRVLNRTLLARQLLLEPSTMAPGAALEHLVGLQAQEPLSPYLALRARLRDFAPHELSGLLERREAVRMVLMRATIHLATAADAGRLRPVIQPVLNRELTSVRTWRQGIEGVDLDPVLALGRELMTTGPRTMAELRTAIGERWPEREPGALAYALRNRLPTVQATPRGLWRTPGAVRLVPLDTWTGRPLPEPATVDDLVLRYLRAFGPATVGDAATWSRLTGLRPVFERLRPRLRTYRDERGRELFDVDGPDVPILTGDEPAPVRFLPDYDNASLSHDDRTRILPALPWPDLVALGIPGSFTVDGFIAGLWNRVGKGAPAAIELIAVAPLEPAARASVEAEASAVLAFLEPAADPGTIRWRAAA